MNGSAPKVFVLLTATVRPHSTVNVTLADPEARLTQYRQAFAWWAAAAKDHGFGILLAENSLVDPALYVDVFDELGEGNFRLYAAAPSEDTGRGKGALEAELVEAAIRAQDFAPDVAIYKVTGRLTLANPGEVFLPLAEDEVVARGLLDNTRVDMRCFGASAAVWLTALSGMAADVDERQAVDLGNVVAARLLVGAQQGQLVRSRFVRRPAIRGTSGTYGHQYGSVVNRLSERFGAALERMLVRLAHAKSV